MDMREPNGAEEDPLERLLSEVGRCRVCAADLPLGPRPVLRGSGRARLMIISQAPGTRAHASGLSFDDRSGDVLRDWLAIDRATFYDQSRVAIMPMGFCYPGRDAAGGDRPPRRECAALWHPPVRALLPDIRLTLLVGSYAVREYLGARAKPTMQATVRAWMDYGPEFLPLPHPSWRTTFWIKRNPWFLAETLPDLRARVHRLLAGDPGERQGNCR